MLPSRLKRIHAIGAACLLLLAFQGTATAQDDLSIVPEAHDASCKVDSDCVVMDVGNCCGTYPACLNVNAKPDPQAVRDKCEKDGVSSICGFPDIRSCSCVEQKCVPAGSLAR